METAMDISNPGTANVHITSSLKEEDMLHCFVCDMVITGNSRFYSLATCRAQKSKSRIIEKLGQLVGDQYMVVIAEDDIICRGCATVVNTLDRLECEMGSLRGVILRFLEKKYSLPEGELVNQKATGMSQPPQIMPSSKPGRGNLPVNSMARKRQAALQQLGISDETALQQENINHINKSKDGSDNKWIQCDKCRYTTKYSSFKYHHLRGQDECELAGQEVEKKVTPMRKVTIPPKKVGRPPKIQVTQPATIVMEDATHESDDSETVEMIAAEISDYTAGHIADQNLVTLTPTTTSTKEPETIKVQIVSQGQAPRKRYTGASVVSDNEKEVTIEMPEISEDGLESDHVEVITDENNQICVMESVDDQMMKMNEEDEDNTVYVQMVDDVKSPKQMLAVSDDGTVEMVEVTWDEMHAAETAAHENAAF